MGNFLPSTLAFLSLSLSGSRLDPRSSLRVVLTTLETLPSSTLSPSLLSLLPRSSLWVVLKLTVLTADLLVKVLMPLTLEEPSTLLVLLTILIRLPSLRSRKSRTVVLLCSPCSDSTFRPSQLVRDLSRTGLSTLLTLRSTVSPLLPPPSSLPRSGVLEDVRSCLAHGNAGVSYSLAL